MGRRKPRTPQRTRGGREGTGHTVMTVTSPVNYGTPVAQGRSRGPLDDTPLALYALFGEAIDESLGKAPLSEPSDHASDQASFDAELTLSVLRMPDAIEPKLAHRSVAWMNKAAMRARGWVGGIRVMLVRAPSVAAAINGPDGADGADGTDGADGADSASEALVHLWPSKHVPAGCVCMDSSSRRSGGLSYGTQVALCPALIAVAEATRMEVELRSSAALWDKVPPATLASLVLGEAIDRILRPGSWFKTYVGGKSLSVEVIALFGDDAETSGSWHQVSSRTAIVSMDLATATGVVRRVDFDSSQGSSGASSDGWVPKEVPAEVLASALRVGGLDDELEVVRKLLQRAVAGSTNATIRPAKGVLLYGPPGTGKTAMVRSLAREEGVTLFVVDGAEVLSKYYGETEAKLAAVFSAASAACRPAVIFVDEIDALAPSRESGTLTQLEKRITSTLVGLLDELHASDSAVLFVAATNRVAALDPSMRRPGRLDRELEIGVPSPSGREAILSAHLGALDAGVSAVTPADIKWLASKTHGFVGADLAALLREAGVYAMLHGSAQLRMDDFTAVLGKVKPSALREHVLDVPNVRWDDIGGQAEAKQALQEAVEWPLRHPEAFVRLGIRPPKGVLLYGPPGCSKTMMAKALATESELNFVAVKGPELFNMWVGESEKAVQALFRKARAAAPCIVFFDEIDALATSRSAAGGGSSVQERVLAQLLHEMDGIEALHSVVVVAATNRPDKIDAALLRPGRMDRVLHVGLPDAPARAAIITNALAKLDASLVAADVANHLATTLVPALDGYTGAEVAHLVKEASLAALAEVLDAAQASGLAPSAAKPIPITAAHLDAGLAALGPPRTPPDLLQFYADYAASISA
ncbi:ATPase family 2 protein [Thecamonas trahens ATCC 50062]|uniref:ATPase family 2 protein n=1 Tax=Thecamonas trahens ATCC 50062 TaxID=461836 RepID=A0A0L0D933_THETB|nr:ATPase family 2 protein [Thecamonas trahens ATCC 50062]KNC48745.1 ATPase family 2 protein [Thecamonas trahens ATCC 50062]|eukprot:XP_013762796.1 ATPase family 2 protein [Thecamonas trahens ATCC 50062]